MDNKTLTLDEVARREARLVVRYGELLTLADLVEVLRYPSLGAIRQARRRGSLNVATYRISGRQGWFATATAVAEYLTSLAMAFNTKTDSDEKLPGGDS